MADKQPDEKERAAQRLRFILMAIASGIILLGLVSLLPG